MTEYALLINGVFKEIRQLDTRPDDLPHKNFRWYPVFRIIGPEAYSGLGDDRWIICAVDPATLPPKVPSVITPRQCRLILAQQGLLDTIETTIAQMDEPTRITWEYALEFRRDDPLLAALGANLGLTPEQIDQFFIAAAQL